MPLPRPNLSPIKTILVALLVVGGHYFIKEGTVITQLGKLADLPPAMPVNPAILKCLLVVPKEKGQLSALSYNVILCHLSSKGTNKLVESKANKTVFTSFPEYPPSVLHAQRLVNPVVRKHVKTSY